VSPERGPISGVEPLEIPLPDQAIGLELGYRKGHWSINSVRENFTSCSKSPFVRFCGVNRKRRAAFLRIGSVSCEFRPPLTALE